MGSASRPLGPRGVSGNSIALLKVNDSQIKSNQKNFINMIIVIHQRTDIILAFLAVQYEDEKK